MQCDRIGLMQGQLNQELNGGNNIAEGLAAWRAETLAAHSTCERPINPPIPPSSTSAIPPTQSCIARTEYVSMLELGRLSDDELDQMMQDRSLWT